jgi:hypothetical protein
MKTVTLLVKWLKLKGMTLVVALCRSYELVARDSHEWPMCADDEVWFWVLVHEPGAGLQPLPLALFGLEPVSDHAGRTRLQHCKTLGQNHSWWETVTSDPCGRQCTPVIELLRLLQLQLLLLLHLLLLLTLIKFNSFK